MISKFTTIFIFVNKQKTKLTDVKKNPNALNYPQDTFVIQNILQDLKSQRRQEKLEILSMQNSVLTLEKTEKSIMGKAVL